MAETRNASQRLTTALRRFDDIFNRADHHFAFNVPGLYYRRPSADTLEPCMTILHGNLGQSGDMYVVWDTKWNVANSPRTETYDDSMTESQSTSNEAVDDFKEAVRNVVTRMNQQSEMYYVLDIPAVQEDPEDTREEPLYTVWDSSWDFPGADTPQTKNMSAVAGVRVHSVLIVGEELQEGLTILSQQVPDGIERPIHVYPIDNFYRRILAYAKENDGMKNPALFKTPVPWKDLGLNDLDDEEVLGLFDSNGPEEEMPGLFSSGSLEEENGYILPGKGKGKAVENAVAQVEDASTGVRDGRATYLRVRREGTGPYYLTAKPSGASIVHFAGAPDWDLFLSEKPEGIHEPLTFTKQCYTIRFLRCGLESKKKNDDKYSRQEETDKLRHREYRRPVSRRGPMVDEPKKYPRWHNGIAKYNESVLPKLLDRLETLVKADGGTWVDNRM
ncbi:hypothetical protein G6011_06741 [Alternaria panax]|uniref:Uncharacterized protein n=1 Tax=Alternaria panax TaxID=48097 RepID=A0AAD4FJ27_9PLEO|nr:hypothetical protein G6011_06741 [Alternaria panax]